MHFPDEASILENNMNSGPDRLAVNRYRYGVYTFLSKIYEREVTTQLLRDFSSPNSPLVQIGDLAELEEDTMKEGFRTLRQYLQGLSNRNLEDVRLELAAEYADLFLGIAGKPPHPSESVYVSTDKLVMGKARDEVLDAYRRAGLDKVREFTEPEDHIAIELNFMAILCQRTVDAIETDNAKRTREFLGIQKEFIEKHLARWIPQLTKDILEQAEVDFYRGIAMITDGFIQMEKKTIDELSTATDDF
jgi:TorA maturation chaperone TorD